MNHLTFANVERLTTKQPGVRDALPLSYARMNWRRYRRQNHTQMSTKKRKRGERAPEDLLSAGEAAEGHQSVVVRWVGLVDGHERDAVGLEPAPNGVKRGFVGDDERVCMRALREVPWTRLSGRVNQVRGLYASGQVCPHDDVVVENGLGRNVGVDDAGNGEGCAIRGCQALFAAAGDRAPAIDGAAAERRPVVRSACVGVERAPKWRRFGTGGDALDLQVMEDVHGATHGALGVEEVRVVDARALEEVAPDVGMDLQWAMRVSAIPDDQGVSERLAASHDHQEPSGACAAVFSRVERLEVERDVLRGNGGLVHEFLLHVATVREHGAELEEFVEHRPGVPGSGASAKLRALPPWSRNLDPQTKRE